MRTNFVPLILAGLVLASCSNSLSLGTGGLDVKNHEGVEDWMALHPRDPIPALRVVAVNMAPARRAGSTRCSYGVISTIMLFDSVVLLPQDWRSSMNFCHSALPCSFEEF